MTRAFHLLAALLLALPLHAAAHEPSEDAEQAAAEQSTFVGRYNGSSFETAMGMVVRPDGSFEWGLSVGSLDLSARGTWSVVASQAGDFIVFKSDPKPVSPEFIWKGKEPRGDSGPFLRVVWAESGKPFGYADIRGLCANGELIRSSVREEGWSPQETCDEPQMIQLFMESYQVLSPPFELTGKRAVGEDETAIFEFYRNDLGVVDFDGVTGLLEDGQLRIESPLGAMTLRKMPPPAG